MTQARNRARWIVPALLVPGAVLAAGAVAWPTQQLVAQGPEGSLPFAEIWLWGRSQAVERRGEASLVGADASSWTLVALVAAVLLALASAMLWLVASRRAAPSGRRRALPVVALVAALVAAGVAASTGLTGVVEFGWFAYGSATGEPLGDSGRFVVDNTVVAAFVPVALGLWVLALLLMVAVTFGGRLAPAAGPSGAVGPAGSTGAAEPA